MPDRAFKFLLLALVMIAAVGIGFFLRRNPEKNDPLQPAPQVSQEASKSPLKQSASNTAKPINRDKEIEAAVENVFDGPNDPVAYQKVLDYIWKEDDLCLATVLLDYHVGQKHWPDVFSRMFQEKSLRSLHELLFSFADEDRDAEILGKLGSPESIAAPLLYAQFAFSAGSRADRFAKVFSFLEKNGFKNTTNGAYYYLLAVAAAEAEHPASEVEALLKQSFEAPELDFGLLPFYERMADAAESSAVNFLAMKKVDKDFYFTGIPTDKILLTLFPSKLRSEDTVRANAVNFARNLETYGAKFRTLAFGSKVSTGFFFDGRILRYLFEHPGYGATWKTRQDLENSRLGNAFAFKPELAAFAKPIEANKNAFEAVATETVENKSDQCLRGDFDAYLTDWKRGRASGGR